MVGVSDPVPGAIASVLNVGDSKMLSSRIPTVSFLVLVISHSKGNRGICGYRNLLYRGECLFGVCFGANAVVACIHNLAESASIVDSSSVTRGREARRNFFAASWKCRAAAELGGRDPCSASRKTFFKDAS